MAILFGCKQISFLLQDDAILRFFRHFNWRRGLMDLINPT